MFNRFSSIFRTSPRFVVPLATIAVLSTSAAYAQVDQGTITGVVQDASGAVVPNANITLTDTNTGFVLKGTSNGDGVFNFTPIKIGDYTVQVSAQGFQAFTQQNVRVDIGARVNLPIALQTGEISQNVTVSDAPPLLESQSSSTGQVISTKAINNTPLNGRNWVYIAQLTAGVAPAFSTSRGGGTGDFISNGLSAEQNNFVLDGVDNNTNLIDFLNGQSYIIRPVPDALAEFKIETGDYSAEFGHSAGAVINASVKSGTNQIHGDVWEYFRNTSLDAQNWNAVGVQPYHQNQFGATLGFPIIKNKLFYFGDIESNRISIAQTSTNSVPTALMRQGNFSELLNPTLTGRSGAVTLYQPNSGGSTALACNGQPNVFCANQIDPVAQRILNLYPQPNANNGKTFNNFVTSLNTTANTVQWDQRLDWNLSPKDQAFARFSYINAPVNNASPLGPILDGNGFGGAHDSSHAENFAGSETHIFSPSLINEFRFGYNWGIFSFLQANAGTDISSQLGLGGVPFGPQYPNNGGLPNVSVSGINTFGSSTFNPSVESQNVYQILDNVTKNIGKHSMRFGVSLQAIRYSSNQPQSSRGQYAFSGLYTSDAKATNTGYGVADFLANQFDNANITNFNTINDARWYRGGYFQDDWKALPSLTLNLGVRYDYYQSAKENAGLQANFVPTSLGIGTGSGIYQIPKRSEGVPLSPAFLQLLAQSNVQLQYVDDERLVKPQSTNFAPRIGFAEQINPRTIIRGGYGLFYGGLQNQGGSNLGLNPPFQVLSSLPTPTHCDPTDGCQSIGLTLENGFSQQLAQGLGNLVQTPSFHFMDAHVKTPYTQDYNLSVERAITSNVVATVAYVGNVSRHLSTYNNFNYSKELLNSSQGTQAVQPFPLLGGIGGVTFAGISNYNSVQAKLEQRTSHGLSYLATYTYGHTFTNVSDAGGLSSGVSYRAPAIIPIADEYTNSPNDTRHRFTFNGNYQLPFGVGRTYLNRPGFLNEIAGGWSSSLTFTAQTGNPFTVSPNVSIASGGSGHAILVGDPFKAGGTPDPSLGFASGQGCPTSVGNRTNWYNPCAFANPTPGSSLNGVVTNAGQAQQFLGGKSEQIYAPGYERVNMSFFKNFTTFREQYLQFRADAFNLLNHPSWGQPSIQTDDPNGGQITGPATFQNYTPDARFFQLALKYEF